MKFISNFFFLIPPQPDFFEQYILNTPSCGPEELSLPQSEIRNRLNRCLRDLILFIIFFAFVIAKHRNKKKDKQSSKKKRGQFF